MMTTRMSISRIRSISTACLGLPSVIALPYNNIVRDCIDLYAERKRNLVRYMLGWRTFIFR